MRIPLLKWIRRQKKYYDKNEKESVRKRGTLRKNSSSIEKTKAEKTEDDCVKATVNLSDTKESKGVRIIKHKALNHSIFLNIGMNFLFFLVFTFISGFCGRL